ncbi:hypothetical protein ACFOU0_08320 [Salinicoccus sesuvii]|uniref:Uncharacterized protein n=1 Tax=Salinicoccus sesuvii TaxID=868281 RepID=A0ABV7N624_9STAP
MTINLVAFLMLITTCVLLFALSIEFISYFLKAKPFPEKLLISTLTSMVLLVVVLVSIAYS